MAKDFLYPGNLLGIHRKAAEKLLQTGNGDAALLYLAFLTGKDGGALAWDADRLNQAHSLLLELGLADPQIPAAAPPPQRLEDTSLPVYSSQDVADAMKHDKSFAQMIPEVEKRLGRGLITQDVKDLMYLTNYLDLSPEVVLMLVAHCAETKRPGGRVTFNQIKKEGLRWYDARVSTVEEADAYIARQSRRRDRHRTLLALLDRPGRDPMQREAAYLDQWMDQGFPDEAIREAYERTVFQVGELRWGYMNGILRSWHEQGIHTPAEIAAAGQRRRTIAPKAEKPAESEDAGDIDWFLAQKQKETEG